MTSDIYLFSLAYGPEHISDTDTCQRKECPKYAFFLICSGLESKKEPELTAKLCVEHLAETLTIWKERFIDEMIPQIVKVEREYWGLEDDDG